MFDRIAPAYDMANRVLSLSLDTLWRRRAIRLLAITRGDRVLDVATGTGDLALRALKTGDCRVWGVDLSEKMLSRAREKMPAEAPLFLIRGDALTMPFRKESFDRLMVAFGIRNMADIGTFLDESRRVLKEGGRMAVLEFSLPRLAPVRWLYLLYFRGVLPLAGGIMSGDFSAYRYLRDSVLEFLAPEALAAQMNAKGLAVVTTRSLFFGIAHLLIAEKQRNEDLL